VNRSAIANRLASLASVHDLVLGQEVLKALEAGGPCVPGIVAPGGGPPRSVPAVRKALGPFRLLGSASWGLDKAIGLLAGIEAAWEKEGLS
jgi:hypothetical protein